MDILHWIRIRTYVCIPNNSYIGVYLYRMIVTAACHKVHTLTSRVVVYLPVPSTVLFWPHFISPSLISLSNAIVSGVRHREDGTLPKDRKCGPKATVAIQGRRQWCVSKHSLLSCYDIEGTYVRTVDTTYTQMYRMYVCACTYCTYQQQSTIHS